MVERKRWKEENRKKKINKEIRDQKGLMDRKKRHGSRKGQTECQIQLMAL